MRIRSNLRGTRGFVVAWERLIRFRSMRNKQEVERRIKVLDFWKEHGEKATRDAFNVSPRTLYRWQRALSQSQGKLNALDPKHKAPRGRRRRIVLPKVEQFIIQQRNEHPRLGKKKLRVLLEEEGHVVSESYVGRVIGDLKKRGLLSSCKKLSFNARTGKHRELRQTRRTKQRRQVKRGMELDTVIRFIDGIKRYILTAIDVERKFAFAGAYTSHSSVSATDFLRKVIEVCPFPINEIQTDNGSEFALNFETACTSLGITHFHTYPRSPKMNAHIERFNRTLSEDFIMLNRGLLRDDLHVFNEKLVEWLIWYNTKRPHESLGLISPLRYILSSLTAEECQRSWTRTFP